MKRRRNKKTFGERCIALIGSNTSLVAHTIFFGAMLVLPFFGFDLEKVLLVLTTAVSLEAIYLALFIQISVNKNTAQLAKVEHDIDEIQEDVDEIQEDVEEIEKEI